ncbi:hypothetical protein C0J52_17839 [Blattella germanica]|nr:hypothetical protein C0J52_17839 [Blattella germanica]
MEYCIFDIHKIEFTFRIFKRTSMYFRVHNRDSRDCGQYLITFFTSSPYLIHILYMCCIYLGNGLRHAIHCTPKVYFNIYKIFEESLKLFF